MLGQRIKLQMVLGFGRSGESAIERGPSVLSKAADALRDLPLHCPVGLGARHCMSRRVPACVRSGPSCYVDPCIDQVHCVARIYSKLEEESVVVSGVENGHRPHLKLDKQAFPVKFLVMIRDCVCVCVCLVVPCILLMGQLMKGAFFTYTRSSQYIEQCSFDWFSLTLLKTHLL